MMPGNGRPPSPFPGRQAYHNRPKVPFVKPRGPRYYRSISNNTVTIEEPIFGMCFAHDSEQSDVLVTSPSIPTQIYDGGIVETCEEPYFAAGAIPPNSFVMSLKNPCYYFLEPPITVRQLYTGTVGRTYHASVLAWHEPLLPGTILPTARSPLLVQASALAFGTALRVPVFGRNQIICTGIAVGNAGTVNMRIKTGILGGNNITEVLQTSSTLTSTNMGASAIMIEDLYQLTGGSAARDAIYGGIDIIDLDNEDNDGTMSFVVKAYDGPR